jgi:hypothetical protein
MMSNLRSGTETVSRLVSGYNEEVQAPAWGLKNTLGIKSLVLTIWPSDKSLRFLEESSRLTSYDVARVTPIPYPPLNYRVGCRLDHQNVADHRSRLHG